MGLLWFLISCGRDAFYEQTVSIKDGRWTYADTARFNFSISDTSQRYHVYLSIEHADTFPFQNIYVRIHTFFPNGEHKVQVLPLDLFDASGRPNGRCSGGVCRAEFTLQERAIFPQVGTYALALEQYMRADSIAGIRALHLSVKPAQKPTEGS